MSEEARHGDSIQSPTELQCNRSSKEMEIIDLYSVGSDGSVPEKPFIHQVLFNGPNGEIVRIQGLFDNSAMVRVMDSMVFSKVKNRLGHIIPPKHRLQMANGAIVPLLACWRGQITLGTVQAEGEFKVFDSGGQWAFLFSKPMLRAFNATQNYTLNEITVSGVSSTSILRNQASDPNYTHLSTSAGINLTLDIKQFTKGVDKHESEVGGDEPPVSNQTYTTAKRSPVCPNERDTNSSVHDTRRSFWLTYQKPR